MSGTETFGAGGSGGQQPRGRNGLSAVAPAGIPRRLRLHGVFGVLPTAFHEDGSLDLDGVAALVAAYVGAGVAGLTAMGVMGEAAELHESERATVLSRVIAAAGDLPVVVGISGDSASVVARRSMDAVEAGASGVMVGPSRSLGLADAVAATDDGGVSIVIQDYLAGSSVPVDVNDVVRLAAQYPSIAGFKAETPPTTIAIARLRTGAPQLDVVGGLGGLFLVDELRAGASGVMTGFALPERLVPIVRGFGTDPTGAEREWTRLLPLMRLEAFAPFNLAARKEVWHLRGVIGSARCRRAGAQLDAVARNDVRRAYERIAG